jgi:hypothetical protein
MGAWVVTGPPAAGKSSWVRARAKPGDIVVDLDLIAQVLTPGGEHHDHDRIVRTVAQRARQAAITEALKHGGERDVYIVHTQPGPRMLRLYRQHGAHVVTVDPGRDVVLARCRADRPHTVIAAVERWYAEHGEHHTGSQSSSRDW